ncbi:hypothetical protein HID58_065114, partial [Brassica napus]
SGLGVPSCAELHLFGLSQSLVVFEVVFLVVGLPFSRTAPRFDDFVLSTLPAMFFHLVAAFNPACVSVTLSLFRHIWKIVSGLKSGLMFLGGWLHFSLTHVVLFFP